MQDTYFSEYRSLKNSTANEILLLSDDLNDEEFIKIKKDIKSDSLNIVKTGSIADIANTTRLLPAKRMTMLLKSVIGMKKIPTSCGVWDALTSGYECVSGVKHQIIVRLIPQIFRREQKKNFKYALHRPRPYSKHWQMNEMLLSHACDKGSDSSSLVISFFDNHGQFADYNFADFINHFLDSPVGNWNRLLHRLNLIDLEGAVVLPIVAFIDLAYIPDLVIRTAIPIQYNGQAFRKVRDKSGFSITEYYDSPKEIKWEIIDEETIFAN